MNRPKCYILNICCLLFVLTATDSQAASFEVPKGAQVGPVAGAFMGVIMALALVIYAYRHHVHNNAQRRRELAQNGSDASVRMSQGEGEAEPEEEEEPENQPPAPGACKFQDGCGVIILFGWVIKAGSVFR